jgi:hypothetical protein
VVTGEGFVLQAGVWNALCILGFGYINMEEEGLFNLCRDEKINTPEKDSLINSKIQLDIYTCEWNNQ